MVLQKKTVRYYYWLIIEFLKKNFAFIFFAFLLSFLLIIGFVSLTPFLENVFLTKKEIIGLIGDYELTNLPDEITSKISNGLVFADDKGHVLPALASSWEIKNNGQEFLFHLKDGLLWNSGKQFNAEDINYSFKDVQVRVIDKKTVYFILKKPFPNFLIYLTKPLVGPSLDGVAGLYRVKNINLKYGKVKKIYLIPNKKNLPLIIYHFYPNEEQLINAYKLAKINQFKTYKKEVAEIFSNWKNTIVNKNIDYSQLLTLFFNFNNQLLKEKSIRQAIYMSINFKNFESNGQRAFSSIPPISWAYNPNLKIIPFDIKTAKDIFNKYQKNNQSLSFKLYSYYNLSLIAEELVNQLKEAGIKVNLIYSSQSLPNNFDFLLTYLNLPYNSDQYFFWHSTQRTGNIGNYVNLKVDKLLEDGRSTLNIEDRKHYYYELQKIMSDDLPAVFLYYPFVYTIKRK